MCLFFFFDFFSSYLLFQINLWVIFIIFTFFFLYTLFPITFTVEYCFQQTKARIFSFGWYFMVKSWFYFNITAFNFVQILPIFDVLLNNFFPFLIVFQTNSYFSINFLSLIPKDYQWVFPDLLTNPVVCGCLMHNGVIFVLLALYPMK